MGLSFQIWSILGILELSLKYKFYVSLLNLYPQHVEEHLAHNRYSVILKGRREGGRKGRTDKRKEGR